VSAKPTKGPWRIAPAAEYGDSRLHIDVGRDGYVCAVGQRGDENAEADARLIVQSPAMRELLERIREALDDKADVVDDGPEQKPNWAMSLCLDIDVLLAKIDGVRL
jgi:hypothetical protein